MSEVTGQDLAHAALRRLSAKEGSSAVTNLLAKLGVDSVTSIPESAIDPILAACPPLPEGQGVIVAAGDGKKPQSDAAKLNEMGRAFNEKNAEAKPAEDIGGALKSTLDQPDGFNNAARALNARDGGPMKSAKAK